MVKLRYNDAMHKLINTIKMLVDYIIPPKKWRLPFIIAAGLIAGLGLLSVHISNAFSYMSDDPKACINCHIMNTHYITWEHSSHREVAVCNDCHVPHDSIIKKYGFKAMDGARHSAMFTLRLEPQVFHMKPAGVKVVQQNCIRCHDTLVSDGLDSSGCDRERLCWDCHREVPHGRVKSLAAIPNAIVPKLEPALPKWVVEKFPDYKNE